MIASCTKQCGSWCSLLWCRHAETLDVCLSSIEIRWLQQVWLLKLSLMAFRPQIHPALTVHALYGLVSQNSIMGRARNCTRKGPQLLSAPESPKKARRKRLSSPGGSLKVIEQLREAGKEAHLKARNTKKCYTAHVKCGREWLASHFLADNSTPSMPESPTTEDIYSDPLFRAAFDRVPNHCSDKALSLFLTFKGFHQNLGKGTVEGIRAAFKDLWDNA